MNGTKPRTIHRLDVQAANVDPSLAWTPAQIAERMTTDPLTHEQINARVSEIGALLRHAPFAGDANSRALEGEMAALKSIYGRVLEGSYAP
ncbi:MAG: hypothetical protein ABIU86_12775 [Gemmatimonadaceae bacterium]